MKFINLYNGKKKTYSDRIIYTPNVLVIKSDDNLFSEMMDEKEWYNIDVISCAAHNIRAYKVKNEILEKIHYNRIKGIIESAIENNVDILILGAYGCGAFGNDPKLVSETFRKILIDEEYYKYFEIIHFAIFSSKNETKNLDEFKNTFEKYLKKDI